MRLRVAVFDFGETLLSEERAWGVWADWIGVSKQELFAAIGATITERRPHRYALELCRPGFDLRAAFAAREAAGIPRHEELYDVYPDAAGALARLRAGGIRVAVAGNQPAGTERALAGVLAPEDFVATSADWGVAKPDPAFFARLLAEVGEPAGAVAYVGDRVDNDIVPAADAGLFTVHLRRGPWGILQGAWEEAARADMSADSLDAVAEALLTLPRS